MSPPETAERSLRGRQLTRRQALRAAVGGGLTLGAGKAVDNVLIGYGDLVGTNLIAQAESGALASIAKEGLRPKSGTQFAIGDFALMVRPDRVQVQTGDSEQAERALVELDGTWAATLELPAPLADLVVDLGALARDEHAMEFHQFDQFFERLGGASTRPLVVDAIRRWRATEPRYVETVTGADPANPKGVLLGLIDGFREHTYYDVPRYLAGSVQDNVIFGAVDLRAPFREPADFEALAADRDSGLFCYEFTHRSLEALHAVPAREQSVPVVTARVWDQRHKHVYTAVASVVREEGDLVVPMTFVDYTHTTLYDDARLRGVLGEGFEAFDARHRASVIHWSPNG